VSVSLSTQSKILGQDDSELYIYTHVREDQLDLYGFLTPQAKRLFLTLLSVSGVGPKTALAISDAQHMQLDVAVRTGNTQFFTQYPRVGKALAQKIIIELKTKLKDPTLLNLADRNTHEQEVFDALTALGFQETHVSSVLQLIEVNTLSLQDAIKVGLKRLRTA